jgi:aryl-alcohol dehydrogenase-like predicted oxidoreductase
MATGHDEAHATRLVEHALELGIDFIDTARGYGTEVAVGKAIRGRRDRVVISSKSTVGLGPEQLITAEGLRESLEKSLRRLDTDYVDVFHLHGVAPEQYPHCVDVLIPELERQREAGRVRFLGITEQFSVDTSHRTLARALPDDHFDVIMVGFNLLNPSARHSVLPLTQKQRVGTLVMFALRRALSRPEVGVAVVERLIEQGQVDPEGLDRSAPFGFLAEHPGVDSLVQAAYRFCRHEPGIDIVLTGTGNADHLRENVAAILAPPLPAEVAERLAAIFGRVDSVSGN